MPGRASVVRVLVAVGLCLAFMCSALPASGQGSSDIAVVVNPAVGVTNLTFAELRQIALGDRQFWSPGVRITLVMPEPPAHARDVALQKIYEKTEAQYRTHWVGKVARAESASPPKLVYSTAAALDTVSRTSGAITFVEASAVPRDAKVLKIDGLLPGQPGYKIK